jgi:hypothetical protein
VIARDGATGWRGDVETGSGTLAVGGRVFEVAHRLAIVATPERPGQAQGDKSGGRRR